MVLHVTDLPVGNYMTAYPISVLPDVSLGEAIGFMARRGFGNLIVSEEDGTPLGILTERDILQQIVSTKTLPNVKIKEVSQQPFVKIKPDTSILDAAKSMISKKGIGSVIVEGSHSDYGIFTERDLVFKVLNNHVQLDEKIELYSSFPLITAEDGILANEAASIMAANNIKRLALKDQDTITGIVTARDIVEAYQNESPHIKNY